MSMAESLRAAAGEAAATATMPAATSAKMMISSVLSIVQNQRPMVERSPRVSAAASVRLVLRLAMLFPLKAPRLLPGRQRRGPRNPCIDRNWPLPG